MTTKLTLEYVKDYIEQFGYEVLSPNYVNSGEKLELQCLKGHIYKSKWSIFQQGSRCPKCSINKKKTPLEEIKQYSDQFDHLCLSIENNYKNNYSKLKFKCPEGHIYETSWSNFKQGQRCSKCKKISWYGNGNPAWKGGISFEPYCDIWLDKEYKESIKNRDRNICLNPTCSKISDKLMVHHIDYNKKNCQPLNLITVCLSCNSKANGDREWHTAWYQAIIYRRYINASQ